jgi:hypothetical protein
MEAKTIAAIGSSSVEIANSPGLDNDFTARTPKTSAILAPAPTTAASKEAIITSFSRIPRRSLFCWWCAIIPPRAGEKPAKNSTTKEIRVFLGMLN